jgi:hypothetical protein
LFSKVEMEVEQGGEEVGVGCCNEEGERFEEDVFEAGRFDGIAWKQFSN